MHARPSGNESQRRGPLVRCCCDVWLMTMMLLRFLQRRWRRRGKRKSCGCDCRGGSAAHCISLSLLSSGLGYLVGWLAFSRYGVRTHHNPHACASFSRGRATTPATFFLFFFFCARCCCCPCSTCPCFCCCMHEETICSQAAWRR